MRLIDAPVGVFRYNGELVLKTVSKTKYIGCDGVYIPDCYILSTGKKFWGGMKSVEDLKTKFNSLEVEVVDVRTEQRWIPCSERLPDEETDVLVTRTFLGCKDGSHGWNVHIPPTTYVEVAQYFDGEWTAFSDEYKVARSRHTNPVAWMPLPEPYKEEKA